MSKKGKHPSMPPTSTASLGSNLGVSCTKTVAPAIQGANRELQAHLAQPVSDRFHMTSPGVRPRKYLHIGEVGHFEFTQGKNSFEIKP